MAVGQVSVIASNTKFHKPLRDPETFRDHILGIFGATGSLKGVDVRIFGHQSVLLDAMIQDLNSFLGGINMNVPIIGPQNMHWTDDGSFTDAAPSVQEWTVMGYQDNIMLGHSELRVYFGETDERVAQKTALALEHGQFPTICLGQNPDEENQGKGMDALNRQITEGIIPALNLHEDTEEPLFDVAWEPLAAIAGFAKLWDLKAVPPTDADIQKYHEGIQNIFSENGYPLIAEGLRILYGGSAKPTNAEKLLRLAFVHGLLIGTASWSMENMIEMAIIASRVAQEQPA